MSEFCFAPIGDIQRAYIEKRLTVRGLVLAYLERIAMYDKSKNSLNSVLEINPDALFLADTLDEKLRRGEKTGRLFGIPVLLKDNINTADRMRTSAGSVALSDNYAPRDAFIAKRLRDADALILGKSNMTEFANYMTTEGMPSGYSSRGGQVLNPYNRAKTPSGSSSGSAVAVSAGLCAVAVGTETCGSIISPAGQNGIVGIKPTLGLVSRSGIIPISSTHDTAGPMARTVKDAAILLSVLAGFDPEDAATRRIPAEYKSAFGDNGLYGVKIGINRNEKPGDFKQTDEAKAAFDNLIGLLAGSGAEITDNVDMASNSSIKSIMRLEFKAAMNFYLASLYNSKIKTLADIIEYNKRHQQTALKFGQSILTDAQENTSGALTEPEYPEALLEREQTIQRLDSLFDACRIDVMICEAPTTLAPLTGFPAMTIPIGKRADNLPLDSYLIARRFCEPVLLKVANAAEQLLGLRLRPEL